MIKEQDLREAIAECQGVRDPNANTCIKLAAYYILLDHLEETPVIRPSYSYAAEPPGTSMTYESGTEFGDAIRGKDPADVLKVIDEAMTLIRSMNPRLYGAILRQIKEEGR